MENKLAIITGADGGMGRHITTAIAKEGYQIIMACRNLDSAIQVCEEIKTATNNNHIEVRHLDLASLSSVYRFTEDLLNEKRPICRLINNAGILSTNKRKTEDGLETIVSVNYVAPYLLTRRLLPIIQQGGRIINTISCTYAIGKIDTMFFQKGKKGRFNRIAVYANTKLALFLFTKELANRIADKEISVNAADPGIVSTNMIRMNAWFDPLTDLLFRPFIKTPSQGAKTTIHLALSEEITRSTGGCFVNCKERKLSGRFTNHPAQEKLWAATEQLIFSLGFNF